MLLYTIPLINVHQSLENMVCFPRYTASISGCTRGNTPATCILIEKMSCWAEYLSVRF